VLATLVIGLREGLEAALIVGIIAAFLRRNGRSLTPMLVGVATAILLSLGVGVALKLLEASLPQAQQEGLETVIGLVAVVFVSSMVVWMKDHARSLKGDLEHAAADALGTGSVRALTVMAFLAVLKEGFETSVFLLAVFSASDNTLLAAGGAVLGIAISVGIGYGLYAGGVRLNLRRFFSITSAFLVLVAAGLLVSTITTAHEAGWLNAGQQRTVDLSWLTPSGTVLGAIFTGVFGIPSDPRLIEVVGWVAYVVPMSLFLFWPAAHRPTGRRAVAIRCTVGAVLAAVAACLAIFIVPATMPDLGPANLVSADGAGAGTIVHNGGTVVISTSSGRSVLTLTGGRAAAHAGVPDAVEYDLTSAAGSGAGTEPVDGLPTTLTIADLAALSGGRLPVGISPQTAPGPYQASWSRSGDAQLWLAGDQVLDYTSTERTTLTLSGGGLGAPRTLTVSGTLLDGTAVVSSSTRVDPAHTLDVADAAASMRAEQLERQFWGRTIPALLGMAALIVLALAWRAHRRLAAEAPVAPAPPAMSPPPTASAPTTPPTGGQPVNTPAVAHRRKVDVS
jgi:high-affinity iron transporter